MKFVAGGIENTEGDRTKRDPPKTLLPRGRGHRVSQSPTEKDRQDGVFGNMRAFTNGGMNLMERHVGNIGLQPAQDRDDKTRSASFGKGVGGGVENDAHPKHHGKPVASKRPDGHAK